MLNYLFFYVLSTITANALDQDFLEPVPNVNYVFNAIHNAMRQFGSSLNHNGMSVFYATVPAGTQFYHGTRIPYRIKGTEWVAFEPEFAMRFARMAVESPKGADEALLESLDEHSEHFRASSVQEHCLVGRRSGESTGKLHTYRTKRQLRLLYVDGQSGVFSQKGTLDTQSYVLLPEVPENDSDLGEGICRLAQSEWNGRIDGIVRMETGFEIILCDFEEVLEIERITQINSRRDDSEDFYLYKAVETRFDGIGGGRVQLDYDDFFSMFVHPESMFFDNTGRPRVDRSSKHIPILRTAVNDMALRDHNLDVVNWQAVTDMVISRYADRIEYLASAEWPNLNSFQNEVDRALQPFIDYGLRNTSAEILRCSHQFIHLSSGKSSLAHRAMLNVTTTLCSTLTAALSSEATLSSAVEQIRSLKEWLAWTHWKKCRGCGKQEICLLPIWPWGSEEDFERPNCRTKVSWTPGGYWGD